MRRALLALLLLILPAVAHAQVNAASCSTADVQTAITTATQGQTVNIPACPSGVTWTTGITITKGINIRGAGSGRIIALDNGTDVHTIATGSLVVNISKYSPGFSSASITAGQTLRVFQSNSRDNWMQGTVTSIVGNVLTMNITSTNGASTTHRWLIATVPTTVLINASSGTMFSITENITFNTSVSGIQFSVGTNHVCCTSSAIGFTYNPGGQPILVHDNWFQHGTGATFSIQGNTNRGVIWNNSFDGSSYSNGTLATTGGFRTKIDNPASGQNAWTTQSFWGTTDTNGTNNLYAETNDFHTFQALTDNDDNARTVFRYNLVDQALFATHGADTSPYGQRYFEYYNNYGNFNGYGDNTTFNLANGWVGFVRGGSFIFHDNNMPAISSQDFSKPDFQLTVFNLAEGANNPSDSCWGAGTAPGSLYHAPRQVGMGRVTGTGLDGKGRSTDETTYVGDSEPIYIWNNNRNPMNVALTNFIPPQAQCTAIGPVDVSANYIILNRDYFQGTAKPNYTPFVYPHPLTGGAIAPPAAPNAPLNLIVNVSGSTATLNWTAPTTPPSFTGYTVYRGTVHNGPYVAIKSGLTSTSTTDTPANGTYFYVVTAFAGGIVNSVAGNGTTATVTCASSCTFPPGVPFTLAGNTVSAFNNTFTVISQPTPTTFTFSSSNNTTGTGGGVWRTPSESNKSNEVSATIGGTKTASLTPASRAFGSQNVGTTSASQSFTFTNTSGPGNTVTISSVGFAGGNFGDFGESTPCGPTPIPLLPGSSCIFNTTFHPTAAGARTSTFSVASDAFGSPALATVSGTGVALAPGVQLSPTSLDFGQQTLSTTSTSRSIILTNTGSGTLTITSVVASGDFAAVTVPVTNCGGSLASLATCSINVTFTPTATGGRTGAITVTDNAAGSPHVASLTGTGITTKCAFTNQVSLSGTASVCQ